MADIRVRTHRLHKVFTKEKWADQWTEEKNFFCDRFTFACGPQFSSAEFSWTSGHVMSYTDKEFQDRNVKDLVDKYVKVELQQKDKDGNALDPILWYGVFIDDDRDYGGQISATATLGRQRILAFGLEWLLERTPLDSSFVLLKKPGAPDEEVEVDRALSFNYAGGNYSTRRIKGNQGTGSKGALFASSLDSALEWDGRDILHYLISYHPPKDKDGSDQLKWKLGSNSSSLTGFKPVLGGHGASVKRVIDTLCDRGLLVGYKIYVDATTSGGTTTEKNVVVQPFSFNKDSITLPSGDMLDPNDDKVELDLQDDARVKRLVIGRDGTPQYRRVIARGERVVYVASIKYASGSGQVDKDWTTANESAYEIGASQDAGFGALTTNEQRKAQQTYRNQDKFERVFRYFKMKLDKIPSWLPQPDTILVNDKQLRLWGPGARFLPVLPLQTDVDYTTPDTGLMASLTTDGREDYLAPFAFILADNRYWALEKLAHVPAGDSQWGATLRMRHDALGFTLDVHGAPQHAIAKDDFTSSVVNEGWDKSLSLSWKDIIATVAVETDNWAEAQWPEGAISEQDDVMKELVITVPDRRMEYVSNNTAIGVNTDGTLKTTTSPGFITDDSEELKNVARLAYEWYRQTRRTVDLTMRTLDCPYKIGQLITKLRRVDGSTLEEVNSVITQISFDLREGSYSLKTQFGELDVRALL